MYRYPALIKMGNKSSELEPSSSTNLINEPEIYTQISEPTPFSLKGLKETLTSPLIYYEKFVNVNGSAIEGIESSLRSLSYILPGRFKDSEFVSEIRKRNLFFK